jgi:hypothetical protein
MRVSKEIPKIETVVKQLLESNPKYRDSDRVLCAKIWSMEIGGIERTKEITAFELLSNYASGGNKSILTNAVSIVRARREVQRKNVALRGANYRGNQDEADDVRDALGY